MFKLSGGLSGPARDQHGTEVRRQGERRSLSRRPTAATRATPRPRPSFRGRARSAAPPDERRSQYRVKPAASAGRRRAFRRQAARQARCAGRADRSAVARGEHPARRRPARRLLPIDQFGFPFAFQHRKPDRLHGDHLDHRRRRSDGSRVWRTRPVGGDGLCAVAFHHVFRDLARDCRRASPSFWRWRPGRWSASSMGRSRHF